MNNPEKPASAVSAATSRAASGGQTERTMSAFLKPSRQRRACRKPGCRSARRRRRASPRRYPHHVDDRQTPGRHRPHAPWHRDAGSECFSDRPLFPRPGPPLPSICTFDNQPRLSLTRSGSSRQTHRSAAQRQVAGTGTSAGRSYGEALQVVGMGSTGACWPMSRARPALAWGFEQAQPPGNLITWRLRQCLGGGEVSSLEGMSGHQEPSVRQAAPES